MLRSNDIDDMAEDIVDLVEVTRTLIRHTMHYESMTNSHSEAASDVAKARRVIAKILQPLPTPQEISHTPGPWVVCVDSVDNCLSIEQDRDAMEDMGNFDDPTVVVSCVNDSGDMLTREIAKHNATIMAASPSMLKALKFIVDRLERGGKAAVSDAITQAKYAISLATPEDSHA